MNLEQLMKPYFEKVEEIQNKYTVQKNFIQMRLERLRQNKESEIASYVENSLADNRNFYAGYGAMVRKDLEQSYLAKEQELENELKNVDKYYRVDVRELVEIKESLRKELISTKKELELSLREAQLESDKIMLELARFKHEYDENHNPINGNEYRTLFERSQGLVEVKYNLQKQLNQVEEYISITDLTQEEANTLMRSMTPWEKEEYDRRKALKTSIEEVVKEENIEENPVVENVATKDKEKEDEKVQQEIVPLELEEEFTDENEVVADSFVDLMKNIYEDVLNSAKKLRSVRIEGDNTKTLSTKDFEDKDYQSAGILEESDDVKLPNGTYLSKKDISDALNNYRKQNKGRVFSVKGLEEKFEITKKTISTVKKSLKDCSIVQLLREKKLGFTDIKRVYGKVAAEGYSKQTELGKVETKLPTGDYINLKDFAHSLKDLFVEKQPTWLGRLSEKLYRKKEELEAPEFYMIEDQEDNVKTR